MPLTVRSNRTARAALSNAGALAFGLPRPPQGWPQKPAGISLCMIVKNEERFLAQCLESVKDAVDEINIVDTGSTDRTIEIARSYGANIQEHAWRNDFAWARNKALDMATRRWVLQLDADEELLPESIAALRQIAAAPSHLTGVWLRCINASDRYKGGGTISHAIIRIFPNHPRVRFHGSIHEFPSVDDSPLSMAGVVAPVKIVHHGYLTDIVADRKKYQRNMAIIEQNVIDHPDDAFHWYNLGMTAHLNGENERAAPALEKMWELCLQHGMRAFTANGLQILADVYSEHLGQPEKGLTYALECLERSPRYANAHFSAGKAYFLLKRYDESREMYLKAIDDGQYLDRQFVVDDEVPMWKAQCEIGSTYAEQGDHARALEWFDKGIANRPAIQPLRINRAKALEQLGRFDEAEAVFKALFDDFEDELSAVDLVNYYLRRGKDDSAIALIEQTYARFSTVAGTTMLLAAASVEQRRGSDGWRYIQEALRIDPDNEQALQAKRAFDANAYVSALADARDGQKERALERLQHIAAGPDEGNAWFLKATLLRELGQPAQALQALCRVRELQPQNVDAMLMKATLHEAQGEIQEAEAALTHAMPHARTRVSVELAALYLRTGRVEEAKRVAEAALT
jgi:glycosyltransferase involved in cell wall biosynthesis/Flp pilus assembly protein TadD